MYVGIAGVQHKDGSVEVSLSMHDGTFSVDFSTHHFGAEKVSGSSDLCAMVLQYVIAEIRQYQYEHLCKFIGAGVSAQMYEDICPRLCSELWKQLDTVPLVFERGTEYSTQAEDHGADLKPDEQADSMARKCIMLFGPSQQPRVEVGYRNKVEVDAGGHARMNTVEDYKNSVRRETWDAANFYISKIKERKVKIAFFNSTPQGGGVALMRHALVRFLKVMGVDIKW